MINSGRKVTAKARGSNKEPSTPGPDDKEPVLPSADDLEEEKQGASASCPHLTTTDHGRKSGVRRRQRRDISGNSSSDDDRQQTTSGEFMGFELPSTKPAAAKHNYRAPFNLSRNDFTPFDNKNVNLAIKRFCQELCFMEVEREHFNVVLKLVLPHDILEAFLKSTRQGRFRFSTQGLISWAGYFFPERPVWRETEIFPAELPPWTELITKAECARAHFEEHSDELLRFIIMAWSPKWAQPTIIETLKDPISRLAERIQDLRVHGSPATDSGVLYHNHSKEKKERKPRANGWHQSNDYNKRRQTESNRNAPAAAKPESSRYRQPALCWAHERFGDRAWARNCRPPCPRYDSSAANEPDNKRMNVPQKPKNE